MARLAYVVVLGLATLWSIRWDPRPHAVAHRLRLMLDPPVSPRDAVDAARNVVLFAGWGVVWLLTAPRRRTRRALILAVATGAAISLTVELMQVLSATRRASVLDLATNTLGALLGAAVVAAAVRVIESRRGRALSVGVPGLVFAGAYGLAVLGEAMVPLFRQGLVEGAGGGPIRRLSLAVSQFSWDSLAVVPRIDIALFLPAGALAVVALMEEGLPRSRAVAWAALAGAAMVTAVEVGHGILGLPILAGAALVHALSVVAGAAFAGLVLPAATRHWHDRGRARVLLAAYLVSLLAWTLRPFVFQTELRTIAAGLSGQWWIPLRSVAERMDVFSVIDVMNGFLLYLPLGALLAVWPLRRRGWLAGPTPAVAVAVAMELAQLVVRTRTLDITDMMVQSAGAVVGWVLVRRAGYRRQGEMLDWPAKGGRP